MGRLKPQDLIFQYYGFAPHGQQGAHFVRIVPIYNVAGHSVGRDREARKEYPVCSDSRQHSKDHLAMASPKSFNHIFACQVLIL